jgi:hypothetical protein
VWKSTAPVAPDVAPRRLAISRSLICVDDARPSYTSCFKRLLLLFCASHDTYCHYTFMVHLVIVLLLSLLETYATCNTMPPQSPPSSRPSFFVWAMHFLLGCDWSRFENILLVWIAGIAGLEKQTMNAQRLAYTCPMVCKMVETSACSLPYMVCLVRDDSCNSSMAYSDWPRCRYTWSMLPNVRATLGCHEFYRGITIKCMSPPPIRPQQQPQHQTIGCMPSRKGSK